VTGTVVDPNGIPYAFGTISPTLVLPGNVSPTLNGQSYLQPTQATGFDQSGRFTVRLADNSVLLPAGTKWNFTVCSAGGTIQPAFGKGPLCFSLAAPITISGASQDITTQLNAVALALTVPISATAVQWSGILNKPLIDVHDFGAVSDGQVALDCSMTAGSAVVNCASSHFAAGDVGKVSAAYDNGPTTSGFVQPLSTTIASFQSATQITLSATASNSTTSTISTITSAARATSVVTFNTAAAHNLNAGQIACVSGQGVDPTIVGCFTVQTVPTGTSFTIKQWQLLDNPTLAITGGQVSGYSSRFVWGTNNDTALQNAVNACGDLGGCRLLIPHGRYLTHGLNLPCSKVGNWTAGGSGVCAHVHNNITVDGDGIDVTVLENWDSGTVIGANNLNSALINLGGQADQFPYNFAPGGPQSPVRGITIRNLTLWQVKNATSPIKNLRTDNTDGVVIDHVKAVGWSYEGFYLAGIHYDAHDLYATQTGLGGPANATSTSALNLIGAWGDRVHDIYVTDSGQCIEGAGPHTFVWNINCDGRGPDINVGVSPHIGVNVSSNTYGTWDVHIDDSAFVAWGGEEFFNVLGKFKDSSFSGNYIVDDTGGVLMGSGKETNNVNVWPEQITTPHGTSVCSNNTFVVTPNGRPVTYFLSVGDGVNPMLENWTCEGTNVLYTTAFCSTTPFQPALSSSVCGGGGSATISNGILNVGSTGPAVWTLNSAYALGAFMQPTATATSEFIYQATVGGTSGGTEPVECVTQGCTFTDGSVTWKLYGFRPQVRIAHTTIHAPANVSPFGAIGQEINAPAGVVTDHQVSITDWNYNLQTRKVYGATVNLIPPGMDYSDNGIPFTTLNASSPPNGTQIYCTDCNATCTAGSSTGRTCFRENGAWTH
jgi:hypothetical protein